MVAGQGAVDFPGAKLPAAVGVKDAAGDVASPGDRVVERGDSQSGLHPLVDRVADDPVGEHVLDRADVELAFTCPVLGDVGEPQVVGGVG